MAGGRMFTLFGFTTPLLLLVAASHGFLTQQAGDYKPLQFSYSGDKGPEKWASLNPNFSTCATGKLQSPINVITGRAMTSKNLKPLVRRYNPVNVTLSDLRYTVAINYPENTGAIAFEGKQYNLKQMHWHSPSEHRIDGRRYDAELHMVHISDDSKLVVVATLFEYGSPDPVLGQIESKLSELAYEAKVRETNPISIGIFHPKELRTTSNKYYRYLGSSSIPPCVEGLTYLVLAEARPISREQVQALKAPLDIGCKYNARPCQPINERRVEVFGV